MQILPAGTRTAKGYMQIKMQYYDKHKWRWTVCRTIARTIEYIRSDCIGHIYSAPAFTWGREILKRSYEHATGTILSFYRILATRNASTDYFGSDQWYDERYVWSGRKHDDSNKEKKE